MSIFIIKLKQSDFFVSHNIFKYVLMGQSSISVRHFLPDLQQCYDQGMDQKYENLPSLLAYN